MSGNLSFMHLSSSVNPSFWNKLSELKLNVYKLDESEQHLWGYYSVISRPNCPITFIEVDSTSFNKQFNAQNMYLPFHGSILNTNTIDQFKDADKLKLINSEGHKLYKKFKNGDVMKDTSLLNTFFILSFADLKKYHYYYWFAFPVPKSVIVENVDSCSIECLFEKKQIDQLYDAYKRLDYSQKGYFLAEKPDANDLQIHTLSSGLSKITVDTLDKYYFVFHNISCNKNLLGSNFRNYIAFILCSCDFLENQVVNFISLNLSRDGFTIHCRDSVMYKLRLPVKTDDFYSSWVGWEKNERDKMGPRFANMRNTLDPLVIADDAVDLNLKLMKWNLLPSIDLDRLKKAKCLLLGAGTLGCSVARTLLGWGIKCITFVDNSTVSYSNPVRQSLFTYQDSVDARPKATAAADNLKNIFPGVNSSGHQMTIPMPGHSVGESMLEQTKDTVEKLTRLIRKHDVVFLLLDSRESRWLPTLIASVENKIVINAALGFDSYLVMRHGINSCNISKTSQQPDGFKMIPGNNLACYFCCDVTAPGDSLKGRTLDQQCTVTRPGVSQIAGALAVELAISILQHKHGVTAPAYYSTSRTLERETNPDEDTVLGLVPHSIRGFLSSFQQILPATEKYKNCVACSDLVITEYKKKGTEFLLSVFNNSKHLEDVALLTDMFQETDFAEVLEYTDSDLSL